MSDRHKHCHCCPSPSVEQEKENCDLFSAVSRRHFLETMTAGSALLAPMTWASLMAADGGDEYAPVPKGRIPLVVLPILCYDLPQRREMTSWRSWGGVQTKEAAREETVRITNELSGIQKNADFPLDVLPVIAVNSVPQLNNDPSAKEAVKKADVIIFYGAGGSIDGIENFGKDVIIFQRWKSGPVYLQYEIVSPRYLRKHTDTLAQEKVQYDDVVTDSLNELTWRLRSLTGLKNTRNTRIIAIGGPDAWAQPKARQDILFGKLKKQFNFDIQTVPYDQLGKILSEAQKDEKIVTWAREKAKNYLSLPKTTLETKTEFVENCFILDSVFRQIMKNADCSAITVLGCMGTIMPQAKTSACLTLSLLNDAGYLAFCESDFAVIPSGILLANIIGNPVFLNDPTYPHDHIVTLAHCTAPRRMDGKNLEPVRLVTHFESDYGAAPKVDFRIGQEATIILPDFLSERWAGFRAKVVDNPFRPICRSQVDVEYTIPDEVIAARMPGFHWMFGYGDYMKELGYALRRVGIQWDNLEK